MSQTYNIYCDESCHLEHDGQPVMVLGALCCPLEKTQEIAVRLREIKARHGLKPGFETKWGKVSKGKINFYSETLDYFFDDDDLHFRALIVPDKTALRHKAFQQTHDDWYYKMYFTLLQVVFDPQARYRIYLDRKDTCGNRKVSKLHEVVCNSLYDFDRKIIERMQVVLSHEIEQLQLCDLLVGAVCYANRNLSSSTAKLALVERIRQRSKYSLLKTTLLAERKINLFRWQPSQVPLT